MIDREKMREAVAEAEHKQWMNWSMDIAKTESISKERLERWKTYWKPYSELPEDVKDHDREYADAAIDAMLGELPEIEIHSGKYDGTLDGLFTAECLMMQDRDNLIKLYQQLLAMRK